MLPGVRAAAFVVAGKDVARCSWPRERPATDALVAAARFAISPAAPVDSPVPAGEAPGGADAVVVHPVTVSDRLPVDDFGTGYSSLSYLTRMPISELKVDQSFMAGIPDEATSVAVVKSIIALAHSLNLSVTAEGVESAEQVRFLTECDCDRLQGYFFSRPLPLDELMARLEKGSRRRAKDAAGDSAAS